MAAAASRGPPFPGTRGGAWTAEQVEKPFKVGVEDTARDVVAGKRPIKPGDSGRRFTGFGDRWMNQDDGVKAETLCSLARAFCDLEETKRRIRMKPLPKAIDVSMQPKRRRAPNLLDFTDPTAPRNLFEPEPSRQGGEGVPKGDQG